MTLEGVKLTGLFMWRDFFVAFALVLILEGVLPFWRPARWRKTMGRLLLQSDAILRGMGLVSMTIGLIVLYFLRRTGS